MVTCEQKIDRYMKVKYFVCKIHTSELPLVAIVPTEIPAGISLFVWVSR